MAKIINITGEIGWAIDAWDLKWALADASGEDVKVVINSPGGLVFEGLQMFNLLKNYEGAVHTHISGVAASMASYLALAGEKRTAEDNSVFMIHNARTSSRGDQNALRKTADVLEGLSDILARKYVEVTGKSIEDIKGLMDAESYFFGSEIMEAGFVNEISGGDGTDTDKKAVMASAKLEIETCLAMVNEHEEDSGKLAAVIKDPEAIKTLEIVKNSGKNINVKNNIAKEPGNEHAGGKPNNTEAKKMNLAELMASDPGLNAEILARDGLNYDKGKTDGTAVMQARIDKVAPYLGKTEYPSAIAALAVKVLSGESEPAALEGAVTVIDAQLEMEKAKAATGEQPPDTPPGNPPEASADGSIVTEADMQASLERVNKMTGNGGSK
jgi:ATP-dependent protease ClpP protease subunit